MRVFTATIAIAVGVLILLGYFLGSLFPVVSIIQTHLLNWAIILAGAATIVGIANLFTVHWDKIRRREKGGAYSAWLILGLLLAILVFGVVRQPDVMNIMVNGIIIPAESMLMGLLTISLLYAAIRLLRRRSDIMGIAFLITAVILIIGAATLPFGNIPGTGILNWITRLLALGGARGILIGIALGALTTGLRVLSGADRPYGGN